MAESMTLPEGFVLDNPSDNNNLPSGFMLDENIQPKKYAYRNEDPFLKSAAQFTAGLYGGTRFMPPVRFMGKLTGAEDIYQNLPKAETLPERISQGVGYVAPTLLGAQPFIKGVSLLPFLARRPVLAGATGFGGYEATKKMMEGQPGEALPAAASGFGSGLAFGAGGKFGASALRRVPFTTLPINPRMGSMAGGAAIGALTSPEDTTAGAILGGGFGAFFPSKPFGKTRAQYQKEAVDIWRGLIRPEKGEIKTIEGDLRKGQKIEDFLFLGAKENLPLSKTPEGKLDTSEARQIINKKQQQINKKLERLLASKPKIELDLFDVQNKSYKMVKELHKKGLIPAADLENMNQDIFQYIQSEIGQNNSYLVDALTLHRFKQGMWKAGYNAMRPTADKSARLIGRAAKEIIEETFPKGRISNLNKQSGQYQVLDNLLLNANGRVIPQGRIGQYFTRGIGTALGAGIGQLVPIPGVGTAVGGALGYKLGGKVHEYQTSPERLSREAALKMQKAIKPSVPFDVKIGQEVGKKLSGRGGFVDYGKFGAGKAKSPTAATAQQAVKQGMGAERIQEVYNLSWNNLSKKIPENYDNLVIPEIENALQRTKGDAIRNKIYNYIIYEFNKGKSEGVLDSINIASSEGTKKVYYKIGDNRIEVKLLSEYEAAKGAEEWAEVYFNNLFKKVGSSVDGLAVKGKIPNQSSISATFGNEYKDIGIREIPMNAFGKPDAPTARVRELADKIKESSEIEPLIVAIGKEGEPYILEGAHRFDALGLLNKKSLPAQVILDTRGLAKSQLFSEYEAAKGRLRNKSGKFGKFIK